PVVAVPGPVARKAIALLRAHQIGERGALRGRWPSVQQRAIGRRDALREKVARGTVQDEVVVDLGPEEAVVAQLDQRPVEQLSPAGVEGRRQSVARPGHGRREGIGLAGKVEEDGGAATRRTGALDRPRLVLLEKYAQGLGLGGDPAGGRLEKAGIDGAADFRV